MLFDYFFDFFVKSNLKIYNLFTLVVEQKVHISRQHRVYTAVDHLGTVIEIFLHSVGAIRAVHH